MANMPRTLPERETVTVAEAAARLGLSRSHTYSLVQQGRLPGLKLGAKVVVVKAALDRMLTPHQATT